MSMSEFRTIVADLMDDITSGAYDQTKTVIRGRITNKVINARNCLGGPLNKFIDCFNDAAITPSSALHLTPNGRLFVLQAIASGTGVLGLWTVDFTNMNTAYVGKVNLTFPNSATTTHTQRFFKAIDTGTSGWKLYIGTTGSVVINGGCFLANNMALSDFVPIGFPTIPLATSNNQKATYFCQDPAFIGAAHTAANLASVVLAGAVLDRANNRLYAHDGVAASHRYHVYDTSVAPAWTSYSGITGVAATDVISQAGHPFINGDQVVFTALTGGTGLVVGTVYFVVNSVAGVSYQLSTTSGGAAFNFTTDITAATLGRAFGISGTQFLHKTGNLPALTGTLIVLDSEDYAEPTGVNVAVDGFPCAYFSTSTNKYLGRLSELTVGAVTWPSLQSVNILGAVNTITAPTLIQSSWSNVLNRAVYITNTSIFVLKRFVNNVVDYVFGGLNNEYQEGYPSKQNISLGLIAIGGMDIEDGILAVSGTTAGQRGVYLCDIRSQDEFAYSYIITKVLDTPQSIYRFINTLDELFEFTGSNTVEYRTSGFGSESGGWTSLPYGEELEGITTAGNQVQFKIMLDFLGLDTCIPPQIYEFILGYEYKLQNSRNWSGDAEHSTRSTESPAKSVAILEKAYASLVPAMAFRAYSRATGSLVLEKFTDTHASEFEYSNNSGTTWTALGTIPNTINTTRLRYNWSTPIPEDVDVCWQEK